MLNEWLDSCFHMNLSFPCFHSITHWLPFQRNNIRESVTTVKWALLRATLDCDSAFLNHFPIQSRGPEPPSLRAATTYQLQTFQPLLPQDDVQPWDPVHLQSMRVSGYCIFSIDVPNDMAITDAGHESKVLNHPASWSVQQVVLSHLLWLHNKEAPHRHTHRV